MDWKRTAECNTLSGVRMKYEGRGGGGGSELTYVRGAWGCARDVLEGGGGRGGV